MCENIKKMRLCSAIFLWLTLVTPLSAQSSGDRLLHYAVEDLATGQVVARGSMGEDGIPANLILGAQQRYRQWVYEHETRLIGVAEFTTPRNGLTYRLPRVPMQAPLSHDTDGDGLTDDAEFILGTSAVNADSDGDGLEDGPEMDQSLNPLDGQAVRTGIVASADTVGTAMDIYAVNDLALVADGSGGVAVFNIFNAMFPVIISRVPTPGMATTLHASGNTVVAACDSSGIAVIDIEDPANAHILYTLSAQRIGGIPLAVTSGGGLAYVGTQRGLVARIDIAGGAVLEQLPLNGEPILDLALAGDYLYVLCDSDLFVLSTFDGGLKQVCHVPLNGSGVNSQTRRARLFAGGDRAYVTRRQGYLEIDISNPEQAFVVTGVTTSQFGWKQLVANGSGLGLAAVGANSTSEGPHHVYLYDLTQPDRVLTEFRTPGFTRAVSIYNGLAYVADSDAGLEVVNYVGLDSAGQPPTISLSSRFLGNEVEEGKIMRLTATVSDDVQVRNVEFYLDGNRVATDGGFPFEFRFRVPTLQEASQITVRARASDTGGNATWTDEIAYRIVTDATSPKVSRVTPNNGALREEITVLSATFSEPMDPAGFDGGFVVRHLDQVPPTQVFGGSVTWKEEVLTAFLRLPNALAPGVYRATLATSLSDLAGNSMAAPYSWSFRIYSGIDSDGDGIPDDAEVAMGLDPNLADSDGDGIPDGLEDYDGDGLINLAEILVGTDPSNPDTDGDGLTDAQEDADQDTLSNGEEVTFGTNLLEKDSDGDGYWDGIEREPGILTNPLDPASKPSSNIPAADQGIRLTRPYFDFSSPKPAFIAAAPPRIRVSKVDSPTASAIIGVVVATPGAEKIRVTRVSLIQEVGTLVANPPVKLSRANLKQVENVSTPTQ